VIGSRRSGPRRDSALELGVGIGLWVVPSVFALVAWWVGWSAGVTVALAVAAAIALACWRLCRRSSDGKDAA
jgi:apolipoprotein N-acyltransferase